MYTPSAKPVHLVKNFHEVPQRKRVYPLVAQEKHDGCYSFAVIAPEDYRIFSRTGKSEFISLKHLSEQLREMHRFTVLTSAVMLIAEVKANYKDGTSMSAAVIAGRCQDETNLFPEAYMVVHDCIPYNDFVAGLCNIQYHLRYTIAKKIAERLGWKYAEYTLVNNEQEAQEFADKIINRGGEGAVFKRPDGIWQAGKKNELYMKIKQELSYDLEVTGVVRGAAGTKYADTLGAIECRFRRFGLPDGEPCTVTCSGMSDDERNAWWNDPTLIIKQIVQVDAMRFTDFGMLREPRFKGIRYDKEQADIV